MILTSALEFTTARPGMDHRVTTGLEKKNISHNNIIASDSDDAVRITDH